MNKDQQLLAEAYEKVLKEEADFNFNNEQPKEKSKISDQERQSLIHKYSLVFNSIFRKKDGLDTNQYFRNNSIKILEQSPNPIEELREYFQDALEKIKKAQQEKPYHGAKEQYNAVETALYNLNK